MRWGGRGAQRCPAAGQFMEPVKGLESVLVYIYSGHRPGLEGQDTFLRASSEPMAWHGARPLLFCFFHLRRAQQLFFSFFPPHIFVLPRST